MSAFQTSPGTRDILPPDAARWREFNGRFAALVEAAGYQNIIPPIFEDVGVFKRVGEATDIVTKEMYDFEDKGGRHLALRPEQTASVCRAFAQHRPVTPWKVWYSGPNFRYEKAQAGRYRQFDQVGVEALGSDDPDLDVEVIALAWRFFQDLGLKNLTLLVNSLGDSGDRDAYTELLRDYLEGHAASLSEQSVATLQKNPLRVLDSKRVEDAEIVAGAPVLRDHIGDGARQAFERVLNGLRSLGIPFVVSDRLVRGLDYYRRTTFEIQSTALDGSQNAVGGGGRYDGLVEDLGGPATGGIGFALGVDRTLLACDAEGVFAAPSTAVDVFVVDAVDGVAALKITHDLRTEGFRVDRAFDGRSMKSQMKAADRSGARIAVIIGADEAAAGTCTVRNLGTSEQTVVSQSALGEHLSNILSTPSSDRPTP